MEILWIVVAVGCYIFYRFLREIYFLRRNKRLRTRMANKSGSNSHHARASLLKMNLDFRKEILKSALIYLMLEIAVIAIGVIVVLLR